MGNSAVLLASIISGSFDVDVAVLTALRRTDLQASDIVVHAVLGAMAANAIGRVILAASVGPARFTMLYAATTTMAIAFGFIVFIWNSQ
ncbi:hypothetical protein [Rhizobium sp. NZLR1b]|uniref:hypothetical protein n=1 Tax=Rhizobium sp. NZLR1b TaxID=2731099 RepID=UPI002180A80E|nr:hypothetical protein [Rhizobium sp. NZLR1b]